MSREEFKKRLEQIFNSQTVLDSISAIKAIITDDTEKLDQYRTNFTRAQARIDHYLQAYDNAANDRERELVIGSVTRNLT